jgi:hypothetical protein
MAPEITPPQRALAIPMWSPMHGRRVVVVMIGGWPEDIGKETAGFVIWFIVMMRGLS